MTIRKTCAGCKHNWYSAPSGQKAVAYPGCDPILLQPHSRCLFFAVYIPMVIERKKGCDGTFTNDWIASEIPAGCPTFPADDKPILQGTARCL